MFRFSSEIKQLYIWLCYNRDFLNPSLPPLNNITSQVFNGSIHNIVGLYSRGLGGLVFFDVNVFYNDWLVVKSERLRKRLQQPRFFPNCTTQWGGLIANRLLRLSATVRLVVESALVKSMFSFFYLMIILLMLVPIAPLVISESPVTFAF